MSSRSVKPMELLAPAGGWEQLKFAIRFGADAVYLATDRFGMRARADNFALDEIPQVVAYAHERGVAVHVTVNTQMYERDLADLADYLHALGQAGVDAFIIGDLGALALAKEQAPHVDIHVSTQASISNTRSALTWYGLGAKRIVCAREMSLADIAAMRTALPAGLEIEVFAHGSMCMAVSGRCLISDFMTDRSGVAGNCAQPCRWKYSLVEETRPGQCFPVEEDERGSYIMNAKDLCMLEHVDKLRAAGIDSIKIEGRNKKAFYVATVVNAYRQVLDGADPASFVGELDTVSHRPYSTGFYFGPAHQTPQDDRYTRNYHWALDVTSSVVLASGGPADAAAFAGTQSAFANRGLRVEGTPASPDAPEGPGAPEATCCCAVQNPALQDSSCVPPLHAFKEVAAQSEEDGVQAVSPGAFGSSSVGSGLAEPADTGLLASAWYTVTGLCRNRFEEGDELEVLSPHEPVRTLVVRDLRYVGPSPEHPGFPPAPDVFPGPVQVANRTMELYSFVAPFELRPHDILRIKAR